MQREGLNICSNTCVSLTVVSWRCSAKSLVRELLTTNPSKRLSASQALKHTWFTASLQSNEDLRLARRNMKRNLRLRFKVSWFEILHAVQSPARSGPRLPPGRYSAASSCASVLKWGHEGCTAPATKFWSLPWTSNKPCNQYVACSSSLHMPGS